MLYSDFIHCHDDAIRIDRGLMKCPQKGFDARDYRACVRVRAKRFHCGGHRHRTRSCVARGVGDDGSASLTRACWRPRARGFDDINSIGLCIIQLVRRRPAVFNNLCILACVCVRVSRQVRGVILIKSEMRRAWITHSCIPLGDTA